LRSGSQLETHRSEERVQQFWRVGNEVFVVLVDGVDGEYGVLADEGMAVLLRDVSLKSAIRVFQLTRHDRTVGMRGSSNSGSRIFCRYLRVAPRMYSLGCC
jgi:hypothetical protein